MPDGFGDMLRRLRIAAGYTQDGLAERANISAKGIAALEAGRRNAPRVTTVRALIDALGLGPAERDELLASATRQRGEGGVAAAPERPGLVGNLPVQRTSFVGRADAVRRIGRAVGKERFVTLIGPGGVGKTRLALAIAESIRDDFPGGCWFVPLSTLTEPTMVANSVADGLGLGRLLGVNVADALRDWFARQHALIVLDNCEHVREGVAAIVDHLLSAESDARIVATSQVPVGVRGEVLRPVLPLTFDATGGESVELFVDRARAVKPDFQLNERQAAAVHEICTKLDHIPLGIELAASRLRAMHPADIAKRLDRHTAFLVNSNADAPERHRSLLHAVRWSVELLTEKEKNVLYRLSVFAAPFDLDAAEVVCSGDGIDEFEVFEVVLSLVDKSLVMPVDTGRDSIRYTLLETIRSFGRDALADAGELGARMRRYAQYYIDLVAEHADAMLGPDDQRSFRLLENEWGHIRATLNIACDTLDTADFDRLYVDLGPVWVGTGRTAEGAQWGERLLDRPLVDPAARVVALSVASSSASIVDSPRAQELRDRAIALWREHDTAPPLTALGFSAISAMLRGEGLKARDLAVQAIELSHTVPAAGHDYLAGVTAAHSVLGFTRERELLASVRTHLEDLMRTGSSWFRISVRSGVGFRMFVTRHPDAVEYLRETIALCDATNNVLEEMTAALLLATRLADDSRLAEAAAPMARAIELTQMHGPAHLGASISRAVVILSEADPVAAATILGGASVLPAHHVVSSSNEDLASLTRRCETELRAALGDAAFAVAFGRGARLGEEEIVTLCVASLRTAASAGGAA